jgi:hypothetical protein
VVSASKTPEARSCEVTIIHRSGGRIGVVRSTLVQLSGSTCVLEQGDLSKPNS